MAKDSLVQPLRTIFVDERFCEEVSELTGIEYRALYSAFVGEEKNLVLDVIKTGVAENLPGTPDDWHHSISSVSFRLLCRTVEVPLPNTSY
jgi:hypothetical protein